MASLDELIVERFLLVGLPHLKHFQPPLLMRAPDVIRELDGASHDFLFFIPEAQLASLLAGSLSQY
jgi:hypothetical protein